MAADPVHICGAGLAGLTAAIALARAGRKVIVHELRKHVGARFHDDLQGLENWTREGDVLDELMELGIETNFSAVPFREVVAFDPEGREYCFRSEQPMAYIVRRGPAEGTLDHGLQQQALSAGVEIRFRDACREFTEDGIVAQGPHHADAIGAGYLFATDSADGAYVALADRLAPKGYAYLLIQGGRGTLISWMYADFHQHRECLERSVAFFRANVGVELRDPQPTGGAANFQLVRSARCGNLLYPGEAAGFQDALWGFGMRFAMLSGHLAGRALLADDPALYDRLWRDRLLGLLRASAVNRFFYRRLGDRGYRALLRRIDRCLEKRPDGRRWLHNYTTPRAWMTLCAPFLRGVPVRRHHS